MRWAPLLVAGLLFTPGLAAQTVMPPVPPLDSTRAALRDALLVLRDSLNTIDGAAARLQRDYRQASAASLLSRARVMREACARSVRTVAPTKQSVQKTKLTDPKPVEERRRLLGAMDELGGTLAHCEKQFASMSASGQAETVRGYGNARAVRTQAAIRKYEQVLRGFFGAMKIRVPPIGGKPGQLAG